MAVMRFLLLASFAFGLAMFCGGTRTAHHPDADPADVGPTP
jgi:hypothetical protein